MRLNACGGLARRKTLITSQNIVHVDPRLHFCVVLVKSYDLGNSNSSQAFNIISLLFHLCNISKINDVGVSTKTLHTLGTAYRIMCCVKLNNL